MATTFGKRVVGAEEYDRAVREQEAGADVFGTRVRGAIGTTTPEDIAEANSEFGPRTVSNAKHDESSVEEIAKVLNVHTGNPTFIDMYYKAELGRKGGPRREAIRVMYEIERSHKGQMRPAIMQQMQGFLEEQDVTAEAQADAAQRMLELEERNRALEAENKLLRDAPRAKALKEREENLKAAETASKEREKDPLALNTVGEMPSLADLTRGAKAEASTGPGQSPSDPTADPLGNTEGPGADTSSSTTSSTEGTEAEETPEQKLDKELDGMNRDQLEEEARRLNLNIDNGQGSLSDGRYSKDELWEKVRRARRKELKSSGE